MSKPVPGARNVVLNTAIAAALFAMGAPAFAQLAPGPNPVTGTVGAQTLTGGTGTVNSGGRISTSGGTTALTMTGTSTLNNNGTVEATGSGRAIDSNSGTANLTVTNTGLISSNTADAFRVNTNSVVLLNNSGTIRVTNGGQALDWAAITSASNVVNNLFGGVISAVGEDAIRPGNGGIVNNAGTIFATPTGVTDPSGSDGIDLRTNKTVTVNNTGTIFGRHGIATDGANVGPSSLTVNNNAGSIYALNGSGINLDGVNTSVLGFVTNAFGATIRGGVSSGAVEGDGDGIDVDGVLTLNNSGDVLGLGARGGSNNAEGIAAGGGSITNTATGRIVGSTLAADAQYGDTGRAGNGILIDNSDGGNAIAATSIVNSGLIQGKTGFGIRIIGAFADSITNNAGGIIRGAGTGAAIQAGDGGDTLTNRGSILSDIGNAIDLQGGNDQLLIEGGVAGITGNVSGGAGSNTATLNLGAGNTFAYAGVLSNFNSVEVQSGHATLSGVNTYSGQTLLSGGTLTLDGVNRISADSALALAGGELELANAGGLNGQTFSSLSLTADSIIDLGSSSLSFNALGAIVDGVQLTVEDWSAASSPDYAFRFLGDLSSSTAFLALVNGTTINGLAADFEFDGAYTNVAAVPLPAAVYLLMSGLGMLGFMGRRRKQTA